MTVTLGYIMDVRDISAMALGLAIAGIIISFSLLVLSDLNTEIDEQTGVTDSAAGNATDEAIGGVSEFADWFTIIALAIVFAIIIGIIVRYIGGAGEAGRV
jgi:amino acid transporter